MVERNECALDGLFRDFNLCMVKNRGGNAEFLDVRC